MVEGPESRSACRRAEAVVRVQGGGMVVALEGSAGGGVYGGGNEAIDCSPRVDPLASHLPLLLRKSSGSIQGRVESSAGLRMSAKAISRSASRESARDRPWDLADCGGLVSRIPPSPGRARPSSLSNSRSRCSSTTYLARDCLAPSSVPGRARDRAVCGGVAPSTASAISEASIGKAERRLWASK